MPPISTIVTTTATQNYPINYKTLSLEEQVKVLENRLQKRNQRLTRRHKAAKNLHRAAVKNASTLDKYKDLTTLLLREIEELTRDAKTLMRVGALVGSCAPNHYKNRMV